MSAWVFGSSSDYSIAVGKRLKDTLYWGRNNVDYTDFDSFIENKQLPDHIFVNIGVEEKLSVPAFATFKNWQDMLTTYMNTQFFVYRLLQHIHLNAKHNVVFCMVTSSITVWPQAHPEHVSYAVLRSIGQIIAFAHSNEHLRIIAVSPNQITAERTEEYAERTVEYMNKGEHIQGIVDLNENIIWRYESNI